MLKFQCIPFSGLNLDTLYDLMALRIDVFIIEQNCIFQEMDGKDKKAHHIIGKDNTDTIVAYARILPEGVSYENYVSIGRVVTSEKVRGKGVGSQLMKNAIREARRLYGNIPIKISAQSHLEHFYNQFGFKHTGESYMEDGIPHIGMTIE